VCNQPTTNPNLTSNSNQPNRPTATRYKWDLVKSVLKSATGLQARKLAELNIPNFSTPDDAAAVLALRPSGGGFKANLRSLLRAGKPGRGARALAAAAVFKGTSGLAREGRSSGGGSGAAGGEEEEGGSEGGGVAGVLEAGSADYMELMRDAMRQKQRQQKAALLLGLVPTVPHHASGGGGGGGSVHGAGAAAGGGGLHFGRRVGRMSGSAGGLRQSLDGDMM
jgi:hypothetical protein